MSWHVVHQSWVLISLSRAIEPIRGYIAESVTQCDDRPAATFRAREHCHCASALYSFPIDLRPGGLSCPEWLVTYQDGISAK